MMCRTFDNNILKATLDKWDKLEIGGYETRFMLGFLITAQKHQTRASDHTDGILCTLCKDLVSSAINLALAPVNK